MSAENFLTQVPGRQYVQLHTGKEDVWRLPLGLSKRHLHDIFGTSAVFVAITTNKETCFGSL